MIIFFLNFASFFQVFSFNKAIFFVSLEFKKFKNKSKGQSQL